MLTPLGIVATLERKWAEVLRAEITGENLFPLQVRFGRPSTTGDFAAIRDGVRALVSAGQPWRIEWQEIQTRKWGAQKWPVRIWCDSADLMAAALGKAAELDAFRAAASAARQAAPALENWIGARPERVVQHLAEWSQLLAVCSYFDEHPQPGCYPRQIPLPISTKFIENNAGILREMLDVVLAGRLKADAEGFCERFGLRAEPAQVRFRFLDTDLQSRLSWPVSECIASAHAFDSVLRGAKRALIVENRDVFLCLPALRETVAVFGAGKAVAGLSVLPGLRQAEVIYWGDLDEAGYGILSHLRSFVPAVRSVFMDDEAWARWRHLAIPGRRDPTARLDRLTASELQAAQEVVAGPWLLEQERIPPGDVETALVASIGE